MEYHMSPLNCHLQLMQTNKQAGSYLFQKQGDLLGEPERVPRRFGLVWTRR